MASSAVRKSAAASSTSTSLRFLGVLKQPIPAVATPSPTTSHLEFDESDMFWSSSSTATAPDVIPSNPHSAGPNSPISTTSSASSFASTDAAVYSPSGTSHRGRRPFGPERSGLSAALAEDPSPLLKTRRPAVDLYLSAARAVPSAAPGAAVDERLVLSGSGKLLHMSAPVNVPVWPRKKPPPRRVRGWGFDDDDEDGFGEEREDGRRPVQEEGEEDDAEEDGDKGEMVPPHIIVARSHVTTFSVFEGVGRTLKGRDLRRVRNAVLQKTGFLD